MANSPQLEWIDISDFTPGIAQRPGVVYPLGQAANGTYRCIADDNGALVPLPRRQNIITSTDYNSGTPDYGYIINGLYAYGGIVSTGGILPIEVFVATEYVHNNQRHFRVRVHEMHREPATAFNLVSIDSIQANPMEACIGVSFASTRDNWNNPLVPGSPTVVFSWYAASGFDGSEKYVWAYPNSNARNSNTPLVVTDSHEITRVVAHQNRIVFFRLAASPFGAVGSWTANEDLYWSAVNNLMEISQGSFADPASILVAEHPTGYAVVLSMSSNELFFVKAAGGGGGYVLGDLDNPSVNNLPNLPSIGVEGVDVAHTPVGTIFPTRYNGVWLFQGGNTAERVSTNMSEDFWWLTQPDRIMGVQMSWAAWGDWVVGPNNWLYDTQNSSWWVLEQTSVKRYRWLREATGQPGRIIAAVGNYAEGGEEIVDLYSRYNNTELANSYQWTSQPLPSTIDREITVKEVMLTLRGQGTVTVNLRGRVAGDSTTQTFTVNSTYPVRLRQPIKAKGSFLQVVANATGNNNGAAPEIHRIELGVQPDNITTGAR